MKSKFKWVGIIFIGVIFIGMQAFVPAEVKAESQADVLISMFGEDVSADEFAASAEEVLPAPTNRDLVFTPVTPCRILDTRKVGGAFGHNTRREYYVYGWFDISSQGGNPAGCTSPRGEPSGVHINVAAIPLAGSGYWTVYPANVAPPLAAVVNYRGGVMTDISNAVSVKSYYNVGPREIEFINMFGVSHLAVDIMGYYYSNPWH